MYLSELLEYTMRLRAVSSRNKKVEIIRSFLARLIDTEIESGVHFIAGKVRQGRLNIGWKVLSSLSKAATKKGRPVFLNEVDDAFYAVKSARGSQKEKILRPLFERMTPDERAYTVSLVVGDVHQGAGEGLVKMAIARASGLTQDDIEGRYLRNPDIGQLYAGLRTQNTRGGSDATIVLFRPVKPMLAQTGASIAGVLRECAGTAAEYKLDGVRIQVHRDRDTVRIFSRNLKDMTDRFPDLVAVVRKFPGQRFILDGEAVGFDENGRVIPFQNLARRTTRKTRMQEFIREIPVIPQFFDLLYLDGEDLTTKTYRERVRLLDEVVPGARWRVKRMTPDKPERTTRFYEESIRAGNEGIVMKALDSPYRPGQRGGHWFKIKHTETIDCVILAAEWGYGRRTGMLSNLHLGVLDETRTKYLMVGKTFKGLTDKMLGWFTENLPRHKVHEDRWTVYVKPAVVVEVAFNGVLVSKKYDSGFSLRFARVKRIRLDKKPHQINSVIDIEKHAPPGTK